MNRNARTSASCVTSSASARLRSSHRARLNAASWCGRISRSNRCRSAGSSTHAPRLHNYRLPDCSFYSQFGSSHAGICGPGVGVWQGKELRAGFLYVARTDEMRRPVSRGMRYAPNVRRARGTMKRRPAMKKFSTVRINGNMIFKGHQLTIGVDLGDRWSCYCVLDEAGEILLEQKVATTPEAMKQIFEKIPRGLIAMETGTHSPWVSRLLTELGHQVLVAHAQKVQLITKSNRKDDRHDARTLARLARIDPELLGPVRHRSAQAQIHLTVIRARAELVSARTALVNAARGLAKSYGERLPKCGTYQGFVPSRCGSPKNGP